MRGRGANASERPADGDHICLREDQLADPLPVATQLALLAHAFM